jgi:hypothetical protein
MTIKAPVTIDCSGVPITVTATGMCPNLNAEYLGGLRAADFAPVSHEHEGDDITSGYIGKARLGTGTPTSATALFGDGVTNAVWRAVRMSDVTETSVFGRALVNKATSTEALDHIGAAAASHYHHTSQVTDGTFSVTRLGEGLSSSSHVLVGNVFSAQPGQWRILTYADVSSAVGVTAATVNRIPVWTSGGTLGNSPLVVGGSSVTTDADFGTNGTVTCTDLIVNYSAATQFKSSIYTKAKSVVQGSASVTVTANDGAQTLTLTASGMTEPTGADGAYVRVKSGSSYSWQRLVGDGLGVN